MDIFSPIHQAYFQHLTTLLIVVLIDTVKIAYQIHLKSYIFVLNLVHFSKVVTN